MYWWTYIGASTECTLYFRLRGSSERLGVSFWRVFEPFLSPHMDPHGEVSGHLDYMVHVCVGTWAALEAQIDNKETWNRSMYEHEKRNHQKTHMNVTFGQTHSSEVVQVYNKKKTPLVRLLSRSEALAIPLLLL